MLVPVLATRPLAVPACAATISTPRRDQLRFPSLVARRSARGRARERERSGRVARPHRDHRSCGARNAQRQLVDAAGAEMHGSRAVPLHPAVHRAVGKDRLSLYFQPPVSALGQRAGSVLADHGDQPAIPIVHVEAGQLQIHGNRAVAVMGARFRLVPVDGAALAAWCNQGEYQIIGRAEPELEIVFSARCRLGRPFDGRHAALECLHRSMAVLGELIAGGLDDYVAGIASAAAEQIESQFQQR